LGRQFQCSKVFAGHADTQWFLIGALSHHAYLRPHFDACDFGPIFTAIAPSRGTGHGAFGFCGPQLACGHCLLRHPFVDALFELCDFGVWAYFHFANFAVEGS
jgi:hypothetical protein